MVLNPRTTASPLAAIAGALAAASCCLPLPAMLGAASLAGLSTQLERWQPYLMAVSVGLVLFAIWQLRRARICGARPSLARAILVWFSAALVAGMVFVPDVIGGWVADLAGTGIQPFYEAPRGQPALRALRLDEFEREFDQAADRSRVLVLLSPT